MESVFYPYDLFYDNVRGSRRPRAAVQIQWYLIEPFQGHGTVCSVSGGGICRIFWVCTLAADKSKALPEELFGIHSLHDHGYII